MVEAVLGCRIRVRGVDGLIELVIPPGTQSGQTFRLRGRGVRRLSDEGYGDLYVTTRVEIPRDEALRVGDPDDSALANAYVGEETPGGTSPTPDQNDVDEIGRAYGLQEEDTGALRSAAEVLARRDRWRSELMPPRKPQP